MIWQLVRDGLKLAELEPAAGPRTRVQQCAFRPAPAFEEFRPLFDRERECLEQGRLTGEHDEWGREYDRAWREIWETGLRLRLEDGTEPEQWIIHVDGSTATAKFLDPRSSPGAT